MRGVEHEAGAAEEEHRDEARGGGESEGALGDGPGLSVESLRGPVRQSGGDVGDNSVEAVADGGGDLLEGRESGAAGPVDPIEELVSRDVGLSSVEDRGEGLLEEIRSVEAAVGALYFDELAALD